MKLGIDFGTCFSFISTMIGNDIRTSLVDDEYKNAGVPTLFYHDGKRTICGNNAKNLGANHPEYLVSAIKRDLKEHPDRAKVGTTYTYKNTGCTGEQIVENYITYLIEMAKENAKKQGVPGGKTIDEVVITAPVGFDMHGQRETDGIATYREMLRRATEKVTKLPRNKVHIIGEPEAAAMYYFHRNPSSKKETVLVYDLGGGTFDAAIVEYDPAASKKYSVLATGGDTKLGGMDWDNCMKKIIKQKTNFPSVRGENGVDIPEDPNQRLKYETAVTESKITLSRDERAVILFNVKGQDFMPLITREEFERESATLLQKTIEVIKTGTLPNYERIKGYSRGTGINHIDKIILVGGASQMPQVRNKLIEEFGKKIKSTNIVSESPQLAIACGAVLYNERNTVMRTNYTYGIKVIDSKASGNSINTDDCYSISNILKKGVEFNGSYVEQYRDGYSPHNEHQDHVLIETYISDSNEDKIPLNSAKKANEFRFNVKLTNGITKAKDMSYRVTFKVTRDNVVEITVIDQFGNLAGEHRYSGDT